MDGWIKTFTAENHWPPPSYPGRSLRDKSISEVLRYFRIIHPNKSLCGCSFSAVKVLFHVIIFTFHQSIDETVRNPLLRGKNLGWSQNPPKPYPPGEQTPGPLIFTALSLLLVIQTIHIHHWLKRNMFGDLNSFRDGLELSWKISRPPFPGGVWFDIVIFQILLYKWLGMSACVLVDLISMYGHNHVDRTGGMRYKKLSQCNPFIILT